MPHEATEVPSRGPWSVAFNTTADHEGTSVTLLSGVIVDDLFRVTALVYVRDRSDIRPVATPLLVLERNEHESLQLLDSRLIPNGRWAWVAWTYARPAGLPCRLQGTIDSIDFDYRAGGKARVVVPGPWVFDVDVPAPPHPSGAAPGGEEVRR